MSAASLQANKQPAMDLESSESDEDHRAPSKASDGAKNGFRAKVKDYKTQAEFPTTPLYQIDEEVYRLVDNQAETGPYLVTAILSNQQYKLKLKSTGADHLEPVHVDKLVVKTVAASAK